MAKDPLTDLQDRLTIAEKQIKELQTALNINTEPIVVVSYKEIPINDTDSDCEYTYSDGSKYRFAWKRKGPDVWVTDGDGGNGHLKKTTQENGYCSDKALGQPKTY